MVMQMVFLVLMISIHVLRAEDDGGPLAAAPLRGISIHVLRAEDDSSRPRPRYDGSISIHVLRAEDVD